MTDPVLRADALLQLGVLCPPTWVCQDLDLRPKLEEMAALIRSYCDAQRGFEPALAFALEEKVLPALEIAEGIGAGRKMPLLEEIASLHMAALTLCCRWKETWMEGRRHYEKVLEFESAIEHPESPVNFQNSEVGRLMKEFSANGGLLKK